MTFKEFFLNGEVLTESQVEKLDGLEIMLNLLGFEITVSSFSIYFHSANTSSFYVYSSSIECWIIGSSSHDFHQKIRENTPLNRTTDLSVDQIIDILFKII